MYKGQNLAENVCDLMYKGQNLAENVCDLMYKGQNLAENVCDLMYKGQTLQKMSAAFCTKDREIEQLFLWQKDKEKDSVFLSMCDSTPYKSEKSCRLCYCRQDFY